MSRWVQTPPRLLWQRAAVMSGEVLSTSARDGHVVVALCRELDVTGAPDAEAAITALVARGRSLVIDMWALDFMDCASEGALLRVQALARQAGGDVVLAAPQRVVASFPDWQGHRVLRSCQRSGRGCGRRQPLVAISVAAACGERCMPWEGSAVAYWDRVIATGAAAAPAEGKQRGSLGCWRVFCAAGCADD
jgi:anti-anti-sigma factor